MCGIAGWATVGPDAGHGRELVEAMTGTLACRGPDDQGVWLDQTAALGHTRMAVIDLAGGRQPMVAEEDGRPVAVLTYSGEVYNFQELRTELVGRGHRFRTRSDTEVVLRAYLEWGTDCPRRLEGMFAFAVWNLRTRELFLVRDRLGIKPLYWAEAGGAVVFGSEPKAILAHPDVRPVVDADGLREVFSMARTPGEGVFRGIRELRPGHSLTVRRTGLDERTYWTLDARPHTDDLAGTIGTIRSMLDEIVARELVADVPVCTLLSGGLDSSTVTALAAKALGDTDAGPVRTTTVTYTDYGSKFQPDLVRSAPDAPYAQAVADHVGADHTEIELCTEDLMDPAARLAVLRAQDVPTPFGDMDTSTYQAFRAVRQHSTVALTGEAADEIFGGYSWVHIPSLADEAAFPWVAFEQWHPGTRDGLGRALFDPGLLGKLDFDTYYADRYAEALAEVPRLDGEEPDERRAREICHLHLTRWLPRLLDRNDRLSMISGLEVRVPFCDHRLMEYVFNVPWSMKTFDEREKSLLRAAAGDLLPEQVLQRPKAPFPVSQDPTYTVALQRELADVLADPNSPVLPLLDLGAARAAATPDGDGAAQDWLHRMNIEMALQVNAWLREYGVSLEI